MFFLGGGSVGWDVFAPGVFGGRFGGKFGTTGLKKSVVFDVKGKRMIKTANEKTRRKAKTQPDEKPKYPKNPKKKKDVFNPPADRTHPGRGRSRGNGLAPGTFSHSDCG